MLKGERICIFLLCTLLLMAGCSAEPDLPETPSAPPTQSVKLDVSPASTAAPDKNTQNPIFVPQFTTTPSPTPTFNPEEVTPTPKQTFVALPPSTPKLNEDGSTPTPTPQWATPYPSPSGEPSVKLTEVIQLVTIVNCNDYVNVRTQPSRGADSIGRAGKGTQYSFLAESGDWTEVLYNGQRGYINSDYAQLDSISLKQTEDISYTVCSLNVHNMSNGTQIEQIAHALQLANVDVICIQEVDKGTRRVDNKDCTELLSQALGYPYYVFSEATEYEGGSFGTAIISRYPIVDSMTVALDVAKGKEKRSMGYARILLDGGAANVFNTHLCPSPMCLKSINLASLQFELKVTGVEVYTVCGDFNCSPPRIDDYLPDVHFVNIDKSTFGDGSVPKILDNILYTDGIMPTDFRIIDTRSTGITDHDMVYCKIIIKKPA